MRISLSLTAPIALAAMMAAAHAVPLPDCRFELQFSQAGAFDVDLGARLLGPDHNARFAVEGSGTYPARITNYDSGAFEISFSTDVSKEVVTVGPTGEALWQIDFTNGQMMAYAGYCGPKKGG
ncbi:hypothetical protein [Actibacterium sp. XHP0104]|uniref:hypothetical protein n=1 Tax=Actibacterium sp. XHP0104 TaxID=2984335 RepID=UPI0021E9AC3F|nr:hypothetical protein [Actibacterium sp. XHP0104]MCV2881109.1 hypothetical protein [Actibacterium sp. XHP0104]